MEFYVLRVLFPAVLIDIAFTARYLQKGKRLRSDRRALRAFMTAPLYFIAALVWIIILSTVDPRFQGQGVLGLIVIWGLGIAFTVLRSILGLILFLSLRHG